MFEKPMVYIANDDDQEAFNSCGDGSGWFNGCNSGE